MQHKIWLFFFFVLCYYITISTKSHFIFLLVFSWLCYITTREEFKKNKKKHQHFVKRVFITSWQKRYGTRFFFSSNTYWFAKVILMFFFFLNHHKKSRANNEWSAAFEKCAHKCLRVQQTTHWLPGMWSLEGGEEGKEPFASMPGICFRYCQRSERAIPV